MQTSALQGERNDSDSLSYYPDDKLQVNMQKNRNFICSLGLFYMLQYWRDSIHVQPIMKEHIDNCRRRQCLQVSDESE